MINITYDRDARVLTGAQLERERDAMIARYQRPYLAALRRITDGR